MNIELTWTNPNSANFVGVRIYRNGEDNEGTATLIHIEYGTPGADDLWLDDDILLGANYYWLRAINASGIESTAVQVSVVELAELTLSASTIAENSAAGTVVGAIQGTSTGSSLSLIDTAGNRFAISGGNIVAGATTTDYEESPTVHSITIRETMASATNSPRDTVLAITVTDVSVTLNALTLSAATIAENSAAGTVVGAVQGLTAGSSLSMTDTAGNRFALDGTTVEAGVTATNYEESPTVHNITLRETHVEGTNSPRDTVLAITVTNVFEQPNLSALTLDTATVEEGTAEGVLVGTLQNVTEGSTLSLTDSAGDRFALDVATADTIETGATPTDYETATSHNITVRETLADSANSPRDTVLTITVTQVAVTLNALTLDTSTIAEGTAAGALVGTLQGVTEGSTLTITDTAGDRFALDVATADTIETGTTFTNYGIAASHQITVRETLAGATNSPRDTVLTITVTENDLTIFVTGDQGLWLDPSVISRLWQDSARTTPVTADGDPVGAIDDGSGNAVAITQGTTASKPIYHTANGLHWLDFDGTDDFMVTGNIVPGVDSMQLFIGVLLDTVDDTTQMVAEYSTTQSVNAGSFNCFVQATTDVASFRSRGATLAAAYPTIAVSAATPYVFTGLADISDDDQILRVNETEDSELTANQGAGNYQTYALYIGSRAGTSLFIDGRVYQLIVRFGASLDAAGVAQAETLVAGRTGVTLP